MVAKGRWVVLGHTDPDLKTISTFAPVLGKDGFFLVLQLLATCRFELCLGDVSSAFMSGDQYDRTEGPLFAELPTAGIPEMKQKSLLCLNKAVYGLGDAPLKWFESVLKYCVMVLGF